MKERRMPANAIARKEIGELTTIIQPAPEIMDSLRQGKTPQQIQKVLRLMVPIMQMHSTFGRATRRFH